MIFKLFTLLASALAVQALEKRTIADGAGDSTTPGAHLSWTYNGASGPMYWGKIAATCDGKVQSPINIEPHVYDFAETLEGVLENPNGQYPNMVYPPSSGEVENKGYTLEWAPDDVTNAVFNRQNSTDAYAFKQFHIHTPSEHRVDGVEYPAEIHFVHKRTSDNALAVIGGFVQLAATSSPAITALVAASRVAVGEGAHYTFDYTSTIAAFKASPRFYRYTGSLTTPPCSEGVNWLVASAPVFNATLADFLAIKGKIKYNARETMPLFDMYDSAWATKRKSNYLPEMAAAAPAASGAASAAPAAASPTAAAPAPVHH